MSKELEKFQKEMKPLESSALSLFSDYKQHCVGRSQHVGLLVEAAKEVGRVVQKLKDGGATGTTMKDFVGAKELNPTLVAARNALAALAKMEAVEKKMAVDAKASSIALLDLARRATAEVAAREKKKDRKILAVDSKSLPDMKKLALEAQKLGNKVKDDVAAMIKQESFSAAGEQKRFDKMCDQEIAQTKAGRKARDTDEKDNRALDLRLVGSALNKTKSLVQDAKDNCARAEKHFKGKDLKEADAALSDAMKSLAALKKIYAPYERDFKKINSYDMKTMQGSSDGKKIISAVEFMKAATLGVSKLIKKTARATV